MNRLVKKFKKISLRKVTRQVFRFIRKYYKRIILVLLLLIVCTIALTYLYLANLFKQLPDPNQLIERHSDESIIIRDRYGEELYRFFEGENREFVAIDSLESHVIWPILAAEDQQFYQHEGVDYLSTLRCTVNVVTKGLSGSVCGGSTITQQLVRNTILTDSEGDAAFDKTPTRKLKEIIIATQVERTYTKDEILQLYINEVPLGGLNYGFQAASQAYFDKDLKDLTLAESAMLAGLLPSPSSYNPIFGNREYAYDRQNYVLDQLEQMTEITGITQEEIDAARTEDLFFTSTGLTEIYAPHFVFYSQKQLIELIGEDTYNEGGLDVTTSLDSNVQTILQVEIENAIKDYKSEYLIHNGAGVILEPKSNEILAMVGSVDFFNDEEIKVSGSINMVTADRQMASLVKPYTMIKAFEAGYGPYLAIPDSKEMDFGYNVTNYDGQYHGIVDIRQTLTQSLNIPALYVYELIGDKEFLEVIDRLKIGMKEEQRDVGITLGLGSADMTLLDNVNAYSVFAREGIQKDLTSILEVRNREGEIIYSAEPEEKRIFSEANTYLLNWSLCDIGNFQDRFGQESYVINGKAVCGKTGTSDNSKDLLAILYHKNLVIGIWNGNSDGSSPLGTVSSRTSLPLASKILQILDPTYPIEIFEQPDSVIGVTLCSDTGLTPSRGGSCPMKSSVLNKESIIDVDNRGSVTICNFTGKIPTNLDTARWNGDTTEYQFIQYALPLQQYQSAYNRLLTSLYPKTLTSDPGKEICAAPTEDNAGYSSNEPVISVSSPANGTQIKRGSSINVKGIVDALHLSADIRFDVIIRVGGSDYYISETTTPFASNIDTDITIPADETLGTTQLSIVLSGDSSSYSKSINVEIID